MSLDPALWEALEQHGLSQEHLEMLLRLLVLQKNGQWTWHIVHGSLGQCDLRLTFPSRRAEVTRVCESILDGASILY
jgi:hypothetical protein